MIASLSCPNLTYSVYTDAQLLRSMIPVSRLPSPSEPGQSNNLAITNSILASSTIL